MALSNIFREPRREITETAVGLLVVGVALPGFLFLDYLAVLTTTSDYSTQNIAAGMFLMPVIVAFLAAICVIGLIGIHTAGESICNVLERRGFQVRPRNRYL